MKYIGKITNCDKEGGIDLYYTHIPEDKGWIQELPQTFWIGCFVNQEETDENYLSEIAKSCIYSNCRNINSLGNNAKKFDYAADRLRQILDIEDDDHVILTSSWRESFEDGLWHSIYLYSDDDQFDFKSVICISIDGENLREECRRLLIMFNNDWTSDEITDMKEHFSLIREDFKKKEFLKLQFEIEVKSIWDKIETNIEVYKYSDDLEFWNNEKEGYSVSTLKNGNSVLRIDVWNWGQMKFLESFYLDYKSRPVLYIQRYTKKTQYDFEKLFKIYYLKDERLVHFSKISKGIEVTDFANLDSTETEIYSKFDDYYRIALKL